MASLREYTRAHPRTVTAAVSAVGYALVIGTFAGVLPIFPAIGKDTVVLLSDLIAVVNTCALAAILYGYREIRRGNVRRHRRAMLTAFTLILVFLVLYLWKVGGGFEKEIVGAPQLVYYAYLLMLAVHILLSAVSVPVVVHAVVLGLTHTPRELPDTDHPTVGRVAVAAWSLSLAFGIVTYLLLNHVYGWVPRGTAAAASAAAALPQFV